MKYYTMSTFSVDAGLILYRTSYFKRKIFNEFEEKNTCLNLYHPCNRNLSLTVPHVVEEQFCYACGNAVHHEFISVNAPKSG